MPVFPVPAARPPDYWYVFGHSYCQYNFVTRSQAGRMDGAIRSMFDIEFNNWANHCVNASILFAEGAFRGGWARVVNSRTGSNFNQYTSPYTAHGGCTLFVYGINDLGFNGNDTQYRTAFANILSMCISRSRVSIWRDNASTATSAQGGTAYGSSWTNLASTDDWSTGSSVRQCTVTGVNSTITITLPSDYKGNPIGLCFNTLGGVTGGTITIGGTSGATGTISVSNIVPAAILTHAPKFHRITSLTSAAASTTITLNMSAVDAGGAIYYDGFWLESLTPPPVIVCNIAKLTDTGYDTYAPIAANSNSTNNGFVDVWNGEIQTVVAAYDSMVQIADIDSAIDAVNLGAHATTPTLGFDGLHPSEFGASRIAVEVGKAVERLRPTTILGASQNNPQSKRSASLLTVFRDDHWYTSTGMSATGGTAYTTLSGDVWAIPFFVSGGQWQAFQWTIEKVVNAAGTAPTVWMAIYDDREQHGYPRYKHAEPTTAVLTIGTAGVVGPFLSTTTPATNGYLLQPLDAGLYWLALKIVAAGTAGTTLRTLAGQSPYMPNLVPSTAAGNVSYSGWKLTGQGTGDLPGKFTAGAVATTLAPHIGLKMQSLGEIGA